MLGDVVSAALEVGHVRRRDRRSGGRPSRRRGRRRSRRGFGRAVCAGLARVEGHALVVNADLPCATPAAIARLAAAGLALVEAEDGTTNALSLPDPSVFIPLYGPGSAARFRAHAPFETICDRGARSRRRHGGGPRPLRPASRTPHAVAARSHRVKVVLLSGGGGGARFARGLADTLSPGDLTVVGNVGDDLEILGLYVSPDLDSLAVHARGPDRRGVAGGAARGRAGTRSPPLEPGAGRTGSGSAIWTSGSISCAPRSSAQACLFRT